MSTPKNGPSSIHGAATSTNRPITTMSPTVTNPTIDSSFTQGLVPRRISTTRAGTGWVRPGPASTSMRSSSDQLRTPQVVQVDHPFDAPSGIHHHQGGDVPLFHEAQGGGGRLRGSDGDGVAGHDLLGGHGEGVGHLLHQAAQV